MKFNMGMKGRFRLEVRDAATLELTRKPLEFDNLILDAGLERLGTQATPWRYAHVGSSSVAPNVSQTTLLAPIAVTPESGDGSTGPTPEPPDYVTTLVHYFRFGVGAAAGNLSEVGVGNSGLGGVLFSRALIVDEEGDPTTITVLPTEILDVYWYLELYPSVEDSVFPITIGGIERQCTARWVSITNWTNGNYWSGYMGGVGGTSGGTDRCYLYTTGLFPITQQGIPGGYIGYDTSRSVAPYFAGSLYRDVIFVYAPGNSTGAIRTLYTVQRKYGAQQIEFDPPIQKQATETLTLTLRFGWGRYVP